MKEVYIARGKGGTGLRFFHAARLCRRLVRSPRVRPMRAEIAWAFFRPCQVCHVTR